MIELTLKIPSDKECYLPHKGIVKKEVATTKLRIVYDDSARESDRQPSLKDYLHPGASLQNVLWNAFVKSRFYPVLLTGDLQKAFLEVRIKEEDQHSLRFLWRSPGSDKTEVCRFTRALFGLTSSPFLLGGIIS